MKDPNEIEKLNYNEESRLELSKAIAVLKDRIEISDETWEINRKNKRIGTE